MSANTIALYAIFCFAGAILPGPTSLLAWSNGIAKSKKGIFFCALGAALSDIVIIALVGLGLGVVIKLYANVFQVIRWGGFLYLLWIAWKIWHSNGQLQERDASNGGKRAAGAHFVRGFLIAFSNPKVIVFFVAFLPQFIDPSGNLFFQYAVLAVLSALIDIVTMTIYAGSGMVLGSRLGGSSLKYINRSSSIAMAGIAIFLVVEK
ncbi:LysE family translocator [Cupriavidus basilensis]|uniref:LysE family translocator n=1 Tax=Cupriavidus basilensis TaxID=68895 RepID=A0ABT6ALY1_9BURK|nr:LysE family translocator [Cupriavidus basilensis]MDF3833614.1 LysE family translocator [Cupriavidus basilensis]